MDKYFFFSAPQRLYGAPSAQFCVSLPTNRATVVSDTDGGNPAPYPTRTTLVVVLILSRPEVGK